MRLFKSDAKAVNPVDITKFCQLNILNSVNDINNPITIADIKYFGMVTSLSIRMLFSGEYHQLDFQLHLLTNLMITKY